MRSNLHVYPTYFRQETRMLKETASLSQAGLFDQICIAAVWQDDLDEIQELGLNRRVFRLKLWTRNWRGSFGKACRLLEWCFRTFATFHEYHIAVVNCHALTTLPLGVFFKLVTGAKLIYDTHELETETHDSRGLRRLLAKLIERTLIRFADSVIVVSPSIAAWYRRVYRLQNVFLVRNLPNRIADGGTQNRSVLREHFDFGEKDIVFIYQGLFSPGRGIELLLTAWRTMPSSHHLVFMGNGGLQPLIATTVKNSANVHLHPAVPLNEILRYTSGADVGIALFENSCLNYYYVLPNKLFEYIFADVPVIVSDFPDMGQIVDEYKCGWKIPVEYDAFVNLLRSIDQEQVAIRREGARHCQAVCGWHVEEQALLQAYERIAPIRLAIPPAHPAGSP